MKTITAFLILCAFSYPVMAQDSTAYPIKLDHNGTSVEFYPFIVYLVNNPKSTNTTLSKVMDDSKMTFSQPTDTILYTVNGNNRWLRKMNGDPFTIKEISILQNEMGKDGMISPAYYTPSSGGDEGIFAPLPNVLVIDRKFVTDEVVHYLGQFKVVVNQERTQKQVALTLFDVPFKKLTIFEIQRKLIEKFPQLDRHVRFENQPLISQRPARGSVSQAITSQGPLEQWNLEIINSRADQYKHTGRVKVGLIEKGCDVTLTSLNWVDGITMGEPTGKGSTSDQLHGTMMAGIIGARNSSSSNIHGVTPFIQIVPIARTIETDIEVSEAISYCILNGVNVINLSFGRDRSGRLAGGPTWVFANIDGALTNAHDHNIVLVAAAGNGFSSSGVEYPARHPNVMAVGASDTRDKLLAYSNHGDLEYLGKTVGISVVAPGATMYVTVPGGSINETETGTSGATAHVSAMAALLKSIKPSLTADSIRYIIESTAEKINDTRAYRTMSGFANGTRNANYGYGRINIDDALARIVPDDDDEKSKKKKFPWLWVIIIAIIIIIVIVLATRKKRK